MQGLVGYASRPDVLERAGTGDADMIIAVTHADEVNMVACQVAHSLFEVPIKIARVRDQSYLDPAWSNLFSRDHLPIDVIISPEIEVARAISRRLKVPGAFEMIPLADDKVAAASACAATTDCPLVNTPIKQLTQLFPDLNIVIVGLLRQDQPRAARPATTRCCVGDDVYFVVETGQVDRAMAAFGHEEPEARRLLICGGGNIALLLAQEIEREHPGVTVKIIEGDAERAADGGAACSAGTVVLHGDVLDPEILEEASVSADRHGGRRHQRRRDQHPRLAAGQAARRPAGDHADQQEHLRAADRRRSASMSSSARATSPCRPSCSTSAAAASARCTRCARASAS